MSDIKSQILYLEQTLEELKAAQRKNYKREPNHPRNIFKYAIVVPNHPLGIHEHYTDCFENAKKVVLSGQKTTVVHTWKIVH
ncbi:MAG: hypothetical protein CM15mV17_0030 [Caudoviricetes sp.]|nr:MAG: hypothetical protein CM15mV17_0030 [Caudoviricetes sp.]